MARNPVEIQADIALTRRVIERQLDVLTRRMPNTWWTPWLIGAGALAVGLLLSRVPMLRLVGAGARAVQAGIAVAGTVAAVDRFLAGRRRPAA
jgi:CHASE2 domain-containing sensor protein